MKIEIIKSAENNPVAEFFSSSDTPETDAFKIKFKTLCGEKHWVPAEHSQRLERERDEAREAIIATLEANRHLADGDDCTLAKLKSVVPDWK